jgi:hypothetical protein
MSVADKGGVRPVKDFAVHPGEDSSLDRTWGGAKCNASALITGDTQIKASAGVIYGYCVHVATATAAIEIRDSLTAGAGTVRITIPASKAIGEYALPVGITCATGIFADYAGTATGTISLLYL